MRTTIRTATRISGAVAGLAIGATILSGCALLPAHGMGDETTLSDTTVTSVRIDDPTGSVSISGETAATGIHIEREIKYWGAKRDIGPTYEVNGDELVLSGCGHRCTVEYSIELPAGVDVSGQTENGAIELSEVNNVEVSTSNGRIELEDVTGRVEVGTSNGRIEGSGLSGDGIIAKTSNGAIDLELATPQDVRANTSNGAIILRVPAGDYEVVAETSNGGENIDIASDPNGKFLLDLGTSNGSITVRDRASSSDDD